MPALRNLSVYRVKPSVGDGIESKRLHYSRNETATQADRGAANAVGQADMGECSARGPEPPPTGGAPGDSRRPRLGGRGVMLEGEERTAGVRSGRYGESIAGPTRGDSAVRIPTPRGGEDNTAALLAEEIYTCPNSDGPEQPVP